MKKELTLFALFLTIGLIFFSGCGNSNPVGPDTNQNITPLIIEIKNFSFNPAEINISEGQEITWINRDQVIHDVTIDNGLFDHDINPGENFSYRFLGAGIYDYHCDIHTSMKGKINVKKEIPL